MTCSTLERLYASGTVGFDNEFQSIRILFSKGHPWLTTGRREGSRLLQPQVGAGWWGGRSNTASESACQWHLQLCLNTPSLRQICFELCPQSNWSPIGGVCQYDKRRLYPFVSVDCFWWRTPSVLLLIVLVCKKNTQVLQIKYEYTGEEYEFKCDLCVCVYWLVYNSKDSLCRCSQVILFLMSG